MKARIVLSMMLAVPYLLLTACGSGVSGGPAANSVALSTGCVVSACHGTLPSTVTGMSIGDEWRASPHQVLNVAGCTTCHKHSHQNSCGSCHGGGVPSGTMAANDPSAECNNCHVSGPNLIKGLDYRHIPQLNPRYRLNTGFNYYSAAGYTTMVGTPYESKCIWCHNPHDNRILPNHEAWAESGHGNTNSGPFANRNTDFKIRGSFVPWESSFGDVCVRCHTASGYINLVTSGMTSIIPWGLSSDGVTPISTTRQTIYCNVCHDNGKGKAYGHNLRQIPALGSTGGLRVHYNYSSATVAAGLATLARARISDTIDYPPVGLSIRCLLCHSGRGTGNLVVKARTAVDVSGKPFNFRNNNRIGMHDFAGGATMFAQSGFELYSSYRYQGSAGTGFIHDQIGAGGRGPCISCHMSTAKSHEFVPVTLSGTSLAVAPNTASIFPSGRAFTVASIDTAICISCHAPGKVGASSFNGTATALTTEKKGYHAALRALFVWLNKKGITSTSNWLRDTTFTWPVAPGLSPGDPFSEVPPYLAACTPPAGADVFFGSRNMGVSFNYDFLKNDPAGYVHNDLYVKRIIYDSLDWIDDCQMNGTGARAVTDAGSSVYFGTTLPSSGVFSSLAPAEVTSALNYLFGVPNNLVRPEGSN